MFTIQIICTAYSLGKLNGCQRHFPKTPTRLHEVDQYAHLIRGACWVKKIPYTTGSSASFLLSPYPTSMLFNNSPSSLWPTFCPASVALLLNNSSGMESGKSTAFQFLCTHLFPPRSVVAARLSSTISQQFHKVTHAGFLQNQDYILTMFSCIYSWLPFLPFNWLLCLRQITFLCSKPNIRQSAVLNQRLSPCMRREYRIIV